MSQNLKITRNGIVLDFVKQDFNITDINNSFTTAFHTPHSGYPIRIVENLKAIAALGEFSLLSTDKKRWFDIKIHIGLRIYDARLEQLELLNGFRKCDINIVDKIANIMPMPVTWFMPNINLQNNDPADVPFTEETETEFDAWAAFNTDMLSRRLKIFPEAKYQYARLRNVLPEVEDPDYEGEWKAYQRFINNRDEFLDLMENEHGVDGTDVFVVNRNIIQPQVYLLTPIFYALQSIGYKMRGSFVNDLFVRGCTLLPQQDQMTKFVVKLPGTAFAFSTPTFELLRISHGFGYFFAPGFHMTIPHITSPGNWKVRWKLNMQGSSNSNKFFGLAISNDFGVFFGNTTIDTLTYFEDHQTMEYSGEFTFEVGTGEETDFQLVFYNRLQQMPLSWEFEVMPNSPDKTHYEPHPTIDWERLVPAWSFGEYVNNVKNLFNLKVDINPITKTVTFKKNNDEYLIAGKKVHLPQDFQLLSPQNVTAESYVLKYANDFDGWVFVDNTGTTDNQPKTKNTKEIKTAFKHVLHLNVTSEIDEELLDRDGVGLFLYSPSLYGDTVSNIAGRHLRINGVGGIHDVYWKTWLRFLVNGSPCKMKGVVSPSQLNDLIELTKTHINRQSYCITSLKYKALENESYEVEFNLVSVFF